MSARRFLILHGLDNERPRGHWQRWLADNLRERGEQVLYPQLPEPAAPSYTAWSELVRAELDHLGAGERVVICHSLACLLWLQMATTLPQPLRVDRVLLAAIPSLQVVSGLAPSFSAFAPSAAAVREASRQTRAVCGDPDPYSPNGEGAALARAVGIEVEVLPGQGHLSPEEGYGPWPGIAAWCDDPGFRISVAGG